ncbi:GNAT family N-acetyltransferase [Patulibacter americanus]|uniref:GNAT family N-acetyltransferase n=1 Tax=Patulibacter americanus TaxID=588672 RepID=UPI000A020EE4|nr:GNAT family N-acetyltransferase [Patulibacter americanus]
MSGAPAAGPAGTDLRVRAIEPRDHDAVLALNAKDVDKLSPMDAARLEWIVARSAAPLVVEDEQGVLGFCLAIASGTDYDGSHYAWFAERYDRFLYLDRIAVADRARRRGAGSALYTACEERARPFGRMLCEVNVVPMNAPSLAFHTGRGYVELERRAADEAGEKVVTMLAKQLPAA